MQHFIFSMNVLLAIFACTTLTIVNCGPVTLSSNTNEFNDLVQTGDVFEGFSEGTLRMPRFTCDLFSAEFEGISVANGMCLAKCATQRKLGGSCQNGICICSDKSF